VPRLGPFSAGYEGDDGTLLLLFGAFVLLVEPIVWVHPSRFTFEIIFKLLSGISLFKVSNFRTLGSDLSGIGGRVNLVPLCII